jgi:hypothetical protein
MLIYQSEFVLYRESKKSKKVKTKKREVEGIEPSSRKRLMPASPNVIELSQYLFGTI